MKKACRKLRMKPVLCGLALLTSFAITGCAGSGGTRGGMGGKKIYVIAQAEGLQFWDRVQEGAIDAADEFGHELHYVSSKSVSDIDGQIALINEAITQNADAIVIAPNDTAKLKESLNAAQNAGIHIIAVDADFSDASLRESYVGTNNLTGGKIAGRHALDAFTDPLNDKALIIKHSDSATSAVQRVGGFESIVGPALGSQISQIMRERAQAAAAANAGGGAANGAGGPPPEAQQGGAPEGAGGPPPEAQQGGAPEDAGGPPPEAQQGGVPDGAGGPPPEAQQGGAPADAAGQSGDFFIEMNCEGDVNIAKSLTLQALKENPEIKVVYATNESSTLGVCQAVQELGYNPDDIKIIGFNSNEAELKYLRGGVADALIVQNPYNMGYLSVYYASKVSGGESVAAYEDTGAAYVTVDNIDDGDIQLILDPKGFMGK